MKEIGKKYYFLKVDNFYDAEKEEYKLEAQIDEVTLKWIYKEMDKEDEYVIIKWTTTLPAKSEDIFDTVEDAKTEAKKRLFAIPIIVNN